MQTWLDEAIAPDGALARCKVCNGWMTLLLQLYADLPERFPGHERRLYIWACRRKACRRKQGSIRGFRAVRQTSSAPSAAPSSGIALTDASAAPKPAVNLGETLFGVKSPTNGHANPFASNQASVSISNPFASTAKQPATQTTKPAEIASLPETFAQKARISSPTPSTESTPAAVSAEDWPSESSFPEPHPSRHIDADKEYLEPESQIVPSNARLDNSAAGEGSSSAADEKAAFESAMDRTFQRFADRLAQNPEQVLRYEYAGQPLLYSTKDAVGKLLDPTPGQSAGKVQVASHTSSGMSKLPRCGNCGAGRVFEMQLTPHAIMELEVDEMSIDGMDWGTIIVAACSKDCQQRGRGDGEVGYLEEWVGVQWEELATKGR